MKHVKLVVLIAVLPLLACGGSDGAQLEASGARDGSPIVSEWEEPVGTDEVFLRVARVEPAFAGYYLQDGRLVFALTDTSRLASALDAVQGIDNMAEQVIETYGAPVAVRVEYGWESLYDWKGAIVRSGSLTLDSVVSFDIDEARNQLAVGVLTSQDVSIVSAGISTLGIPPAAFRVEVRPPVQADVLHLDE